jgi:mannose-1-phosphate guanylyltransferase
MPSDHYISQKDRFLATVKTAAKWAHEHNDLVTLGIQPSRPETGYGYLKTSDLNDPAHRHLPIKKVDAFVEKPNLEKAMSFLAEGNYFWNGGMFIWKVRVILEAFDRFMPEMKMAWEKSKGNIEKAYPEMTATSIDYGIMEKASNVVSFPLECGWDDLGSWTSLDNLADSLNARKDGNVITAGELLSIDSKDNIIDAPQRLISLLGVKDLIIVEHGDAILVAHKSRAQDIRKVVDEVKKRRSDLA